MNSKKARTQTAAERLTAIAEEHLRGLSPANRADRLRAFHQVVAKALPNNKLTANRQSGVIMSYVGT